MARRKNLTREFDSAIDVDFLKNRILHDAFAKLAAEQDAYNEQMGYPANGTTGELPIQEFQYGGRKKFQTGTSINDFLNWEDNAGAYGGLDASGNVIYNKHKSYGFNPSVNNIPGYDPTKYEYNEPDNPEEAKLFYDTYYKPKFDAYGIPENTPLYDVGSSFGYEHAQDPRLGMLTAAGLITPQQRSDLYIGGDQDAQERYLQNTPENMAKIDKIWNANKNNIIALSSDPDYLKKYKGTIDDIYQHTGTNKGMQKYWGERTNMKYDNIMNNYASLPDPNLPGGGGVDRNTDIPIPNSGSGGGPTVVPPVAGKSTKGLTGLGSSFNFKPYIGDPNADWQSKMLLDYMKNRGQYKENGIDKGAKWGALAAAGVDIAAAFQKDKNFGKFPHYTPTDLNIDPAINDLINQGQLNTNNVMDRLRSQSGSAGSYMTNAITASGQSQENTARSIMQLRMEAAARNKAATDQAGQFNAQQDTQANLAKEQQRGARWSNMSSGIGKIGANLGAFSQENKANYLQDQQSQDQLFMTMALLAKKGDPELMKMLAELQNNNKKKL